MEVIPDGGVVADTESQVQSQIAQEEAESRKTERIITHEEAHAAIAIDVSPSGPAIAEVSKEQSKANKSAESPFATILAMLKGGLEALQEAELSRSEVSELEDVCMDFKRELYAAEKRGRA